MAPSGDASWASFDQDVAEPSDVDGAVAGSLELAVPVRVVIFPEDGCDGSGFENISALACVLEVLEDIDDRNHVLTARDQCAVPQDVVLVLVLLPRHDQHVVDNGEVHHGASPVVALDLDGLDAPVLADRVQELRGSQVVFLDAEVEEVDLPLLVTELVCDGASELLEVDAAGALPAGSLRQLVAVHENVEHGLLLQNLAMLR